MTTWITSEVIWLWQIEKTRRQNGLTLSSDTERKIGFRSFHVGPSRDSVFFQATTFSLKCVRLTLLACRLFACSSGEPWHTPFWIQSQLVHWQSQMSQSQWFQLKFGTRHATKTFWLRLNPNFCQNVSQGGASSTPNSNEANGAHSKAGAAHRLLVEVCPLSKWPFKDWSLVGGSILQLCHRYVATCVDL